MLTFEEYLTQTAAKGEGVNLVFEQRLFELVEVLHKITDTLAAEDVLHEVIGGLAVLIHVEEADPTYSMLTGGVDVMIRRSDAPLVEKAVQSVATRKHPVNLFFTGERIRSNQTTPNPPISPERKQILGKEVWVIPVADLVRMELSAYRDKDRVHTRIMDAAGLIKPQTEASLPTELLTRLHHIRQTE